MNVSFSLSAGVGWPMRAFRMLVIRAMQWLVRRDDVRFMITLPDGCALVRVTNGMFKIGDLIRETEATLAPGINEKDLPS